MPSAIASKNTAKKTEKRADLPGKPPKIVEVPGIGAIPHGAHSFSLSRRVEDGSGLVTHEPMVIVQDDGIEVRSFPIAHANLPWIRDTFGPGRYRLTMKDREGKPKFGNRTVGAKAKPAEAAAPAAVPNVAPRTPEELALERTRMELDYKEKSLRAESERNERFFTEMKELLRSVHQPAPVAQGLTKKELDEALEKERRTQTEIAELRTKLAVAEVTGTVEDDEDEDEDGIMGISADSVVKLLGSIDTICKNPNIGPFAAAMIAQIGAPILEGLADRQLARTKKRAARDKEIAEAEKAQAEADQAAKEAEAAKARAQGQPPPPEGADAPRSRPRKRRSRANGVPAQKDETPSAAPIAAEG